MLPLVFGFREGESESGAAALIVPCLDGAGVLLNDAVAHSEAQPRTIADALGGEKRVEDLVEIFFRNAAARVADLDQHLIYDHPRDQSDRPAGRHRIAC